MSPRPFIASFAVGGSSNDQTLRCIGWPELLPGGAGVADYLAKRVAPAIGLGATRLMPSNPWGNTISANGAAYMPASQLLLAKRIAALAGTWRGWAEAWAPLVAKCAEVLCYTGGLNEDTTFSNLGAAAYIKRVRESFAPVWAAGMSQAFDAEVLAPNGSKAAETVKLISQDRRVYVEAWWQLANTWCWDYPCIVRDDTYRGYAGRSDLRPLTDKTPEMIRILTPPPGESVDDIASLKRWAPKAAALIRADGHTPLVNGYPFVDTLTPFADAGLV